ncbi:biosynthetic-type acetolactate synthase large subunit [Taurinivorans muris]|mgnify:FL=1|uniref:Acetolactate synthase n=1 Tax=Taurinivorans muris TaxID=2787751 RepID=A0ABY5Y4M4_9BACT|nr:biosynthetic-type acetolactate synthase large subunit [Desulfovibrionaceae bacterium LT0009]
MELTGAAILMECLKREGVDVVFGYPGGAVLDLYHEMRNHPEIRHVLVRHEQGAAHAADGYARASGNVGVCIATSGPGATNTVTGLATAYADSIPMVLITGQVHTHLIGNDAFQEVDIVGITRPCTKHNYLVKDLAQLPRIIREAFHLARSGRPGPVLVDFPKDLMTRKTKFIWPEEVRMRTYNPTYKPNLNQLRRVADLVCKAESPVVIAGGGVISSNASKLLRYFVSTYQIPVTCTLMGLGAVSTADTLYLGMLGMHGTYTANKAVSNADLILAVGCRFDDRVTGRLDKFGKKAKIVHIDIDPTSIRKNVEVDVPVVGHIYPALEELSEIMATKLENEPIDFKEKHQSWLDVLYGWKKAHPLFYHAQKNALRPQQVLEAVRYILNDEYIITTEVGQNQMWAAQFLAFKEPRTLITSGGLGTMGYGLPAAIGAQIAYPDKTVIDVAGDASIQMNIQELMTAVANRLPVKILILNNQYMGMVRQWQEFFYEKNYAHTNMEAQPDFVKLAEAYGADGYRITNNDELKTVLPKALTSGNATIIDVIVEREENVYPMVPAGASLDDMLLV